MPKTNQRGRGRGLVMHDQPRGQLLGPYPPARPAMSASRVWSGLEGMEHDILVMIFIFGNN